MGLRLDIGCPGIEVELETFTPRCRSGTEQSLHVGDDRVEIDASRYLRETGDTRTRRQQHVGGCSFGRQRILQSSDDMRRAWRSLAKESEYRLHVHANARQRLAHVVRERRQDATGIEAREFFLGRGTRRNIDAPTGPSNDSPIA